LQRSHGRTEVRQIKFIDEEIDNADEAILADPVLETIREKRHLAALHTLDETGHGLPSRGRASIAQHQVLTQARLRAAGWKSSSAAVRREQTGPSGLLQHFFERRISAMRVEAGLCSLVAFGPRQKPWKVSVLTSRTNHPVKKRRDDLITSRLKLV